MANKPIWTEKKKETFFDVIRTTGNASAAARVIGVSRSEVYAERDDNEAFREKWDSSYEEFLDDMESALSTRNKEGVLEPVFYQGKEVGHVKKFSDTAGIAILNGRRSQIFRQKMDVHHSGSIAVDHASRLENARKLKEAAHARTAEKGKRDGE